MELASLYRHIVESSPDGIWVIDLEGHTIYANAAIAQMYGIAHEDVGTLTVHDTLDEAGRAQFNEHLRAVRAGESNKDEVEVFFVDRVGRGAWVTLRESVLHDDDGRVTGLLHRLSDYESRRHVLEELKSNRAQLEEAQRIARLGSWGYDATTRRVSVFAGDPRLVPESPIRYFADFLALAHPDDVEPAIATLSALLTTRTASETSFDTRVRFRGAWTALRVRGMAHRDPSGHLLSITGTYQDVTEMRATETALRDEIQRSAMLRAISNAANGAQRLSDVFDEALPVLLTHRFWTRVGLYLVESDDTLVAVHDESGSGSASDRELAVATYATKTLTWDDAGSTVAAPIMVGDHTFAIGTITSSFASPRRELVESMVQTVAAQLGRVAEREEASRALAAARDEAMSASRQKSEFLATMSHEIRTPLNGIIGLNNLLLRTPLDSDQQRLASGVHVAGRALLSVISDVLDFSKIDGRPVELEEVDIDLRSMLDQVVRVLSGNAASAGVEILASCDHAVPASVVGDPTRLSQVLLNLVSNAVKFSPQGDVLIRTTVDAVTEGRVTLRFEVRDNGIGIDPERVGDLFEPFTQADTSTSREYGGTGLGLAIARTLVTALGGELTHAPNPGGGSVFAFTAIFRSDSETTAPDDYARTWLSDKRVLIVDAIPRRAEVLCEQLTWWHLRPEAVADTEAARTALDRAQQEGAPYAAIIIAVGSTGEGLALATAIAQEPAYDKITMIAVGQVSSTELERLREIGVSVVLERPLPTDVLRGTLLEQLAGVEVQPRSRSAQRATAPRRGARVLVVEDNPVNQLVATGMLESLGYEVGISPDGAHALDLLATDTFDAILMDVQMPVLNGYETTRTLREREDLSTRIPIIAMTAAAIDGERERCLAAGMDDFLTKPVDLTTLAATLARWLPKAEPTMADLPDRGGDGASPPTDPIEGLDTERLDMLRDLDPGDTTYIDRAIGNFQVNSAAAVEKIRSLISVGDATALKATAHKIAGSALNLGVPRAGEAARAIELLAYSGSTDGADALLPELEEAMQLGRELLLAYQRTYSL